MYGLPRRPGLTPEGFWALICPEDREAVRPLLISCSTAGPAGWSTARWSGDDTSGWSRAVAATPAQGGREPYLVGVVRDVTRLREEEAQLAARRADLTAVTAYLAETTDTTDLRAIVSSVKRTIRKRMDVAVIGVFARQGERISGSFPEGWTPCRPFNFRAFRTMWATKR